jgi:hypothetical protein
MARIPSTGANRTKKPPKWVLHEWWLEQHGGQYRAALLRNIKERLPGLEALRAEVEAQWPQDRVHPFDSRYFQVIEVYYRLQPMTRRISSALQNLLPDRPIRKHFLNIVAQGTEHQFDASDPPKSAKESEAILNAFFIAYYYLIMACHAGLAAKPPGKRRPHWWSALLFLFELS